MCITFKHSIKHSLLFHPDLESFVTSLCITHVQTWMTNKLVHLPDLQNSEAKWPNPGLEDHKGHHRWGSYYTQEYTMKCSLMVLLQLFYLGEHGYSFHTIMKEEQRSFSQWINTNLGSFPELSHLLPLKDDGADLYEKIGDGILLW